MSRVYLSQQHRLLRKTVLAMSLGMIFGPSSAQAVALTCDPNTDCTVLDEGATYVWAGVSVSTTGVNGTKSVRDGQVPVGAEMLDQGAIFNLNPQTGGQSWSSYQGVITATSQGGVGYEEGDSGNGGGVRLNSAGQVDLAVSYGHAVAAVLYAKSSGGSGPTDNGNNNSDGGDGGWGGSISVVTYNSSHYQVSGEISDDMSGIFVASLGGAGGAQNSSIAGDQQGGTGGNGQSVQIDNSGTILFGNPAQSDSAAQPVSIWSHKLVGVIRGDSEGGGGGEGNGNAGDGGDVTINHNGGLLQVVAAGGDGTQTVYGIRASSEGADGYDSSDDSDPGGQGGDAGTATVNVHSDIDLQAPGMQGAGVEAISEGGQGGDSPSKDHSGGAGGVGKTVTVTAGDMNSSSSSPPTVTIGTTGSTMFGIQGLSKGGFGGDGSSSTVLAGKAGGGGVGGDASAVNVNVGGNAAITTSGDYSSGVVAWSVGGGGGTGGDFIAILGGSGSKGGDGGESRLVTVKNNGAITTSGDHAFGIDAQSNAGGGGAGGIAEGLIVEIGGDGGIGGLAGGVTVVNAGDITTGGSGAVGISAQSNGGGGGNAGGAGGIIAVGGNPYNNELSGSAGDGQGAKGGIINIANSGTIITTGDGAEGILAQSVGGGGGKAEDSVTGIVAVGGNGAAAGDAGNVYFIADTQGTISTSGDYSYGINAQSIGGGGGNGGSTTGISAILGVTVGGNGAAAGDGGYIQFDVSGTQASSITTLGDNAHGILAQSIGGGGGASGDVVSVGIEAIEATIGSDGASGGGGGLIDFDWSDLTASTSGAAARGIMLQSIGGGGGAAGSLRGDDASVLGQVTGLIGGKGGAGGDGGDIHGTLLSSTIVTGVATDTQTDDAVDDDGDDDDDDSGGAPNTNALTTDASAISLQSIGGGGGTGGSVTNQTLNYGPPIFEGGAASVAMNFAVGGSGGDGGDGGDLGLTVAGSYAGTAGQFAHGIYMQSIGGGGGDGGSAENYMFQLDTGDVTVGFEGGAAVGGWCGSASKGCAGGDGGDVTLYLSENGSTAQTVLDTRGDYGNGVLAQSIGGGGGDGGTADSYSFGFQTGIATSISATTSVGSKGGDGGNGGVVKVNSGANARITTRGSGARGIVAQSIGGGGGTGQGTSAYLAVSDQVTKAISIGATLDVGVGMSGGSGGTGNTVTVNNSGLIATTGRDSDGILAQSVGGGGGIGGSMGADQGDVLDVISNALQTLKNHLELQNITAEAQVSVGGKGGDGGDAGDATVNHAGTIYTGGDYADAIVVQSIGGGGGTGGASTSETYVDWFDANVSVGGQGGTAGNGATATANLQSGAKILTRGYQAYGVLAHSIGGGGGQGGNGTLATRGRIEVGAGVGGGGGDGSDGGTVNFISQTSDAIRTLGDASHAVALQSIGGGGGIGGLTMGAGGTRIGYSLDFSLSIGGKGGSGGNGGEVNACTDNSCQLTHIYTDGASSTGLLAQSVGGGGGDGVVGMPGQDAIAAIGLDVDMLLGGGGGDGGNGGNVNVGGDYDIATTGASSHGIVAQSIGGGGGMASSEDTSGVQVGISGVSPDIQIVMSVGSEASGGGGNGGNVDINASGSIGTQGDVAHALVAQSIGGGGGMLGTTLSDENLLPMPPEPDPDDPNNPRVPWLPGERYLTIGASTDQPTDNRYIGDSGVAGSGVPAVDVTYDGVLKTAGDWSMGMLAQSIGGGGGAGHAGMAFYGQLQSGATGIKVGSPDMTGKGGDVDISLTAGQQNGIATLGNGSYGVLAQSISDGGGLGTGMVFDSAAQIQVGGGSPTITAVDRAGQVNVFAPVVIYTAGEDAIGLAAQAVGGGGGVGGVLNWEGTSLMGAQLLLGGYGPGQGGAVSVTANQAINTQGNRAYGVVAQSIGGGGGIGVIGVADARAPSGLTVDIGGKTTDNVDAAAVQFNLDGTIMTTGRDADGAVIQSIGGGGGLAGATGDQSGPSNTSVSSDAGSYGVTLTVGGDNNYGDGGAIGSTSNAARMAAHTTTFGDFADGLVVQSIGGGGGQGSAAASGGTIPTVLSMQVGGGENSNVDNTSLTTTGGQIALMFDGDADGTAVSTLGYAANGVVVQSIGGGGGIGAASAAGGSGDIQLGATQLVQGNGGNIEITQGSSLSVTTQGDHSHGMIVQSIGGGGGIATVDTRTRDASSGSGSFTAALGGIGGTGGNLDLSFGGMIKTSGQAAIGVIAQSIGGGGGIMTTGDASTLASVAMGSTGSPSDGDGQTVELTLESGSVSTLGAGSHGVVAQSIGSGGGIAGDLTQGIATDNGSWDVQTGWQYGNGGDVTVRVNNFVGTSGPNAFGVIAQSIGGGGGLGGGTNGGYAGTTDGDGTTLSAHAGNVTVTVNDTVSVTGDGSTGILAQRQAYSNGGDDDNIKVNINGSVQGGSGDGVGVWISNHAYNASPNVVTVAERAQLSALSNNAIRNDGSSALTVDVAGHMAGNVLCDDGVCAVNVADTGVVTDASLYQADVVNAGRVVIGHTGGFGAQTVAGDYSQTSSGTLVADVDFSGMRASRMTVEGDAQLDGRLALNTISLLPKRELTVLNVQGNTTGALQAIDSPIFDFDVQQAGKAHRVSVQNADFNASAMNLARNQSSIARSLQDIWNRGGNAEMAPLFAVLNNAATQGGGAYKDQLSNLSPGVTLAPAAQMAVGMARFTGSMMSCPAMESTGTDGRERDCVWGEITRRSTSQDASNGTSDFSFDSTTYQVGGQHEFRPGWFIGGSAAYQNNSLRGGNGHAGGSGDAGYAGVVLKYQDGPWVYSGAIGGGYGSYSMDRNLNIQGYEREASSSPDVYSMGARLRAARHIGINDQFYLKPYVDLDLIYTRMPSYTESGDALSLDVDSSDQFQVGLSPMLEIGGRVDLPHGATMRPYAYAGASFLSDDSWDTRARFSGAPAGSDGFNSTLAGDHVVGRVGVGMQVNNSSGLDFRLQYDGEFSSKTTSHAGQLKVMYRF